MNKNDIGLHAGIVWKLLSNHQRPMKYDELKKGTELSDPALYAAIGWLAREDKIMFEEREETYFFLPVTIYF